MLCVHTHCIFIKQLNYEHISELTSRTYPPYFSVVFHPLGLSVHFPLLHLKRLKSGYVINYNVLSTTVRKPAFGWCFPTHGLGGVTQVFTTAPRRKLFLRFGGFYHKGKLVYHCSVCGFLQNQSQCGDNGLAMIRNVV